MNAHKYYIEAKSLAEPTSYNAVTNQFDFFVDVYMVMKRRWFREDKLIKAYRRMSDAKNMLNSIANA